MAGYPFIRSNPREGMLAEFAVAVAIRFADLDDYMRE